MRVMGKSPSNQSAVNETAECAMLASGTIAGFIHFPCWPLYSRLDSSAAGRDISLPGLTVPKIVDGGALENCEEEVEDGEGGNGGHGGVDNYLLRLLNTDSSEEHGYREADKECGECVEESMAAVKNSARCNM